MPRRKRLAESKFGVLITSVPLGASARAAAESTARGSNADFD
jgi:hypothetical protein